MMSRLFYGVGINDADYEYQKFDTNGKVITCPVFSRWSNMLMRCYNQAWVEKNPTYKDCTVCDEWLTFSNFRDWMGQQDWEGKELDKDYLKVGNKVYCPEYCIFISPRINKFMCDAAAQRGDYPLGVVLHKLSGKFHSKIRNHTLKKVEHLGTFTCPGEAHKAWKLRKHTLACQLADTQSDARLSKALRERYS